jgi:hypothetical protein
VVLVEPQGLAAMEAMLLREHSIAAERTLARQDRRDDQGSLGPRVRMALTALS